MAGLGSHSFRRGCALALFHVGAGREAVTEVLRHRSLLSSGPYVTDAELVADLAVTMAAAAPSRPFPVAAVGSARIGAPGHSAVIQFRLQSSPTRSGEFLLEWGGLPWERGLISRCHAGWVSGRDCLLEFVTRPTKLHMLARLATWTVHGEYPTAAPELHTGTQEFTAGALATPSCPTWSTGHSARRAECLFRPAGRL